MDTCYITQADIQIYSDDFPPLILIEEASSGRIEPLLQRGRFHNVQIWDAKGHRTKYLNIHYPRADGVLWIETKT